MDNIVKDYSTSILDIFKEVVTRYESNEAIISQTEDELNDLYHEAELSAPKDMYHGYLIYKEIREVRLKRRSAKEENELLKEMYDYIKSQIGTETKNTIQKIQGHSIEQTKIINGRTYKPRQRSDLTITDKTCTAYKPFEDLLADFNKTKITSTKGKLRKNG